MPEKAKAIDTNLIIRFLVEDDVKKADAVEKLLKKAEKEKGDALEGVVEP